VYVILWAVFLKCTINTRDFLTRTLKTIEGYYKPSLKVKVQFVQFLWYGHEICSNKRTCATSMFKNPVQLGGLLLKFLMTHVRKLQIDSILLLFADRD
jgi:hypothetical protein